MRQRSPPTAATSKDTRVILIWLDGGPSHTLDISPDAPPSTADVAPHEDQRRGHADQRLFLRRRRSPTSSIVRSIWHNDGDHFGGAHRMPTGRPGATGANTMAGIRPSA
jgi:hypothetical protein